MTLKLKTNINLNERCGSLNKFEFLQEEQNLELTLDLLSKEILNYIQKRKDVADYILEYRKKFIEADYFGSFKKREFQDY